MLSSIQCTSFVIIVVRLFFLLVSRDILIILWYNGTPWRRLDWPDTTIAAGTSATVKSYTEWSGSLFCFRFLFAFTLGITVEESVQILKLALLHERCRTGRLVAGSGNAK